MNWLDKAISWVAPEAGLRRVRARRATDVMRLAYEGARTGRRTDGWIATGNSANAEIAVAISKLRERSRDLIRNNAYAARAVAEVIGNAVGTGITAQSRAGEPELNRQIDSAWLDWMEQCDADGQADFYGLQVLVARTVFESGECLVRFRQRRSSDGLKIPIQLHVLEPDYLDHTKTQKTDTGYIIQGVEFDLLGRRTFYWLYGQHPGDVVQTGVRGGLGALQSIRVPASEVLHIYRKDRPGQVRGVPWLAPVIITLRDLDEYEEAELVRKKIEACFAAFVTQPQGPDGPPIGATDTASDSSISSHRVESFEPGMIEYLKPGEEITFAAPTYAAGYRDYVAAKQSQIATGLQLTYEQLTGDLSRVNYSSYRAGLLSFRNGIEVFRWATFIPMFCIPVWNRVMQVAFAAGEIADAGPFKVEWTPPGFGSVDPYKDAVATLMRIRTGTLTLRQAIALEGFDPDAQIEQIAEINRLLDEKAIILDGDPRKVSKSGAEQSSVKDDGGNKQQEVQ
ncbi:MAG: phage portal protein [Bryobacterales bacterium]|nr:phage portal protein [Bryobacterales bacterium]